MSGDPDPSDLLYQGLYHDITLPFALENADIRGRIIRLGDSLDDILKRHNYPQPIANHLGQFLIMSGLLSSAFKTDGIFTLQLQAEGILRLMLADCTKSGDLRGCARFEAEGLAQMDQKSQEDLTKICQKGTLSFTVDQADHQRYQGYVPLEKAQVNENVQFYFRQSEQIDTAFIVFIGREEGGREEGNDAESWCGGGMMIQRLPDRQETLASDAVDHWRRVMMLLQTVRKDEMLHLKLSLDELLLRLFHEDNLQIFTPQKLQAQCRCSSERVLRSLTLLSAVDLAEICQEEFLDIGCEFCGRQYHFSQKELRAYLQKPTQTP